MLNCLCHSLPLHSNSREPHYFATTTASDLHELITTHPTAWKRLLNYDELVECRGRKSPVATIFRQRSFGGKLIRWVRMHCESNMEMSRQPAQRLQWRLLKQMSLGRSLFSFVAAHGFIYWMAVRRKNIIIGRTLRFAHCLLDASHRPSSGSGQIAVTAAKRTSAARRPAAERRSPRKTSTGETESSAWTWAPHSWWLKYKIK